MEVANIQNGKTINWESSYLLLSSLILFSLFRRTPLSVSSVFPRQPSPRLLCVVFSLHLFNLSHFHSLLSFVYLLTFAPPPPPRSLDVPLAAALLPLLSPSSVILDLSFVSVIV